METPKTLAEAVSLLKEETAKNKTIAEELALAGAELLNANAVNENSLKLIANYESQVKSLQSELENLKAEQASVDQKVAAALASLAVPPVASVQQEQPDAKIPAREKLAQIKDPMARAIFRRDHFEDLLKNR